MRWLFRIGLLIGIMLCPAASQAASASDTPLIVRGDRNFPPYEFIDATGTPSGFNIDLVRAIAESLGLDIDIVLDEWEGAQEELARGDVHLISGMIRSPERETRFDFSMTHAGVFYCLFVRKNSPIKTFEDARGKAILVHAKAYSHDWLVARDITRHIVTVASPQDALTQLAQGLHDCAVVERLSALTLIENLKIKNVVIAGPPLFCAPYAFAVKKGADRLLALVNEGIHRVHQEGRYDNLYRKWFSVAEADARQAAMVRIALLSLAGIAGLLVAVLVWTVTLRRLVRQRTADLEKSRKRFKALGDLLPQTVFETDANGRLTFLNRSGFEMLGVDPQQSLEGFQLGDFMPEVVNIDTWLNGEDRQGRPCIVRGPAVDPFPALIYATRVTSGQDLVGWRGLLVDITFQKELEKQVIEAQKMEALGQLAGGVAHDFNNIVNGISAYAQLIKTQPEKNDAIGGYVEKILVGCDRAGDLVRHFLVTAGRRQVEKQPVHLKTAVHEVFNLLQPTCGANITLDNRIGAKGDVVWAEPALVFQILMNLCVNGVQAMAERGGVLTVGWQENDTIPDGESGRPQRAFFVSDQGPGIDPDVIDHIFEPFFTTRRKQNGTGIGLFVVSQALAEAQGSIRVESEPGKGARFIVCLPRCPRRPINRMPLQKDITFPA